ncbi:MAG: methylated-DNA--[protein]-cysteine S-methyltransferase [Polyangiales bacterium]
MTHATPIRYATFDTRIGRCAIAWGESGIVGFFLPEKTAAATVRRASERLGDALVEAEPTATIARTMDGVRALLEGELSAHETLARAKLDFAAVPEFHRKVYERAREIRPGEVRSYAKLAEQAGSAKASRAVGQSMAKNPFPVIVPCHRVLAANQKIGGFSAPGGVETKLKMLAIERDAALRASSAQRFAFDPDEAVAHLRKSDRTLKSLVDRVGAFSMKLDPTPSVFTALAQAIAYQQLTGKAAETIWTRVVGLFPYRAEGPDPALVAKTSHETLRSAGLSTAKALAMSDLAKKCVDHTVPTLEQLSALDDATVIERLTSVRGVGRWTVEMLLMFRLGRPDVLPVDDYGVKKGFQRTFGGELPTKAVMLERAQKWAPFRSVASWYLWRANELPQPSQHE